MLWRTLTVVHVNSPCVCVALCLLAVSSPRAARADDFHGRLYLGPAFLHNDHGESDSSGYGIAAQLDLGARITKGLALHGTAIADDSQSMGFTASQQVGGEYVTRVLGVGVGATGEWHGFALGASSGAQLTLHPDPINPNDGPSGAGLGPFVSTTLGYVVNAFDDFQLGAHALARYRVGKDEEDPSGYQLGLVLSVGLADDERHDKAPLALEPEVTPRDEASAIGALSAQLGWWNAELELLTQPGIYFALGGPWVGAVLGVTEDRLIIPFGARIGYQHELSSRWKLRAAAHFVGLYGSAGVCYDCSSDANGTDSWQLFELGARYESGSGLVYGIDVPLLVVNDVLGLDNAANEPFFAPPTSLAFLQLYVGYSWPL